MRLQAVGKIESIRAKLGPTGTIDEPVLVGIRLVGSVAIKDRERLRFATERRADDDPPLADKLVDVWVPADEAAHMVVGDELVLVAFRRADVSELGGCPDCGRMRT